MRIVVLGLVATVLGGAASAQIGQSLHAITGDDGKPVANHAVSKKYESAVEKLPGKFVVGNPKGNVTIAEFYDLNCPYCHRAAADIAELLKTDPQLRVVLVPFPVLGIPSIQAGRVEFAVGQMARPEISYEFYRKIFSGRGVVDGQRALDVAAGLKLDIAKLTQLADDDDVSDAMKSHVLLGNALGLQATPSYVIGGVAILGHPGRKALGAIVAAMRQCGKVVC